MNDAPLLESWTSLYLVPRTAVSFEYVGIAAVSSKGGDVTAPTLVWLNLDVFAPVIVEWCEKCLLELPNVEDEMIEWVDAERWPAMLVERPAAV